MAVANLSIYYTWKNIKSVYNNNKFKISAPTWNDTFNLPDGSYSVFDIQDYFEYIIKKHETIADNPPVQIYANKIKNRIVFKIKTGYKLELLTKEIMRNKRNNAIIRKLKKDIDQNKMGSYRDYQHASKVLFIFVPNKQFGQLITITPHSPTMLKTTNAEFSFIETWFTDQSSVNITLIIGAN